MEKVLAFIEWEVGIFLGIGLVCYIGVSAMIWLVTRDWDSKKGPRLKR